MSRKKKHSKNWKKAKAKVTKIQSYQYTKLLRYKFTKIHSKKSNVSRDFLHKASTTISKNYAMVSIEDLQIRNMSRSSKGSIARHGKRVAQKSGLNRSILNQGWGEFRRQLTYKMEWRLFASGPPRVHKSDVPVLWSHC